LTNRKPLTPTLSPGEGEKIAILTPTPGEGEETEPFSLLFPMERENEH